MDDGDFFEVYDHQDQKMIKFSGHPVRDIPKEYFNFVTMCSEVVPLLTAAFGLFYKRTYADYETYLNTSAYLHSIEQYVIELLNMEIQNRSTAK